jgi:hypothetical protein
MSADSMDKENPIRKIFKLHERVPKLNSKINGYVTDFIREPYLNIAKRSYSSPFTFSLDELEEKLSETLPNIDSRLKNFLLEGVDFDENSLKGQEGLSDQVKKISSLNGFYQRAHRFQSRFCIEKVEGHKMVDIRNYLHYKGQLDSDGEIKKNENEDLFSTLESICDERLGQKRCGEMTENQAINKTNFEIIFSHEVTAYKDYLGLIWHNKKINCPKGKEKDALNVPIHFPSESLYQWIKSSVDFYWNSHDMKIGVSKNSDLGVKAELSHTKNSWVMHSEDQATIYLGKNSQSLRSKITAHEFGHILGFNDCYVEFIEEGGRRLVYYEIDPNNIMCNVSGTGNVLAEHIEKLKSAYCE